MASKKRSGLGRGIGALIPQAPSNQSRPVDVFFPAAAKPAVAPVSASENDANAIGNEENSASETQNSPKIASNARKSGTASNPIAKLLKVAENGSQESDFSGGQQKNDQNQPSNHSAADVSKPSSKENLDITKSESALREVPGAHLTELRLDEIIPNRVNPRKEFEVDALQELSHSIKEFGVFQPIVVRAIEPQPAAGEPQYELIMGERRYRASRLAGKETIPAIIRSTQDEDMLRDALLENLHRADLNPLEEASAYQQLMSDFGITQEQLAAKIGRSRPQISNTIRLLKLPESVQLRVAAGVLSAGHARAILSLSDDTAAMEALATKIVNQDLTVREAELLAKKPLQKLRVKPRPGGRKLQLDEISERLGDRLDTKVSIKLGAKKGQLVIDFATIADLNRILAELDDPGFN